MRLLLIVEDDQETRSTMALLLSEEGYSVCDAADGARALEKSRSLHPDLVLLDYGLPAPKDGEDFLRAKAADPEIAAIPVVVLSGYNLPTEMDGTAAVVQKPFEFDAILAVIERLVGPPLKPNTNSAA
jgi:CheY-like chemotaxis protein